MDNVQQISGFIVIAFMYFGIGVMVIFGCVYLSRKMFAPRAEQIFYALILMPIAAFYWACIAYFNSPQAVPLESSAIILFIALALAGMKNIWVLIAGYVLHRLWDSVHEIAPHLSIGSIDSLNITEIPLGYGIFCATFDIGIALYFFSRRKAWRAAD